MNPNAPKVFATALALACVGAAQAQQTLTFSNTDTNPGAPVTPLSVTLLAGSSVSIAPDGNVSAQCALTGSLCTGLGTGGGGAQPTVELAGSNFTPPIGADNLYNPGTTFTLTPTVTNAEICVRTVSASTPANTNWPATVQAPFAAQVVAMAAGDSTYQFSMRCYGPGGATTATLADLRTRPGNAPDSCTGFQVPLPAGWGRSAITTTSLVPSVEGSCSTWNPFPQSGCSGYVITSQSQYSAIEFNTPTEPWAVQNQQFFWQEAQQNGAADLTKVYISISQCPGDFRIPPVDTVAPVGDPTFASGCRSFRRVLPGFPQGSNSVINYQINTTPANESTCQLAPGRRYFINFIRANVADGSIGTPAQEATCLNPDQTSCGVQMRYY